jgi:hypothetical protein
MVANTLSQTISTDLTHVSVPTEDISHMRLRGPALSHPLIDLTD